MAETSLKGFFKPVALVETKTKQQVSIDLFVKPVDVSTEFDDDVICTGIARPNKHPEKMPVERLRIIRQEKELDLEEFHDYHELVRAVKWYEAIAYAYFL